MDPITFAWEIGKALFALISALALPVISSGTSPAINEPNVTETVFDSPR